MASKRFLNQPKHNVNTLKTMYYGHNTINSENVEILNVG